MLLGPWIDTAQALLILAIESLSSVDVTMKWLWRNAKLSTTQMGGGSDGGVLEWSEGLGLLLQRFGPSKLLLTLQHSSLWYKRPLE
ncbi:hypothetical protein Tco_1384672 [Tanacetum coccineum]